MLTKMSIWQQPHGNLHMAMSMWLSMDTPYVGGVHINEKTSTTHRNGQK
jgi:hypothetical protein